MPWAFFVRLNDVRREKNLEPEPVFCWMSLLTPKEDEVEFSSFMPEPLLLNDCEADRYLIGDWLNSDINNFNILKHTLNIKYFNLPLLLYIQNSVIKILSFQVPFNTNSPFTYTDPFPLARSFSKNPVKICPLLKYIVPGPYLLPF